jgi:hypothetical protein
MDHIEATRLINSGNSQRGKDFEQLVSTVFAAEQGLHLKSELTVPIGRPSKDHKFDLGSLDPAVVVECKNLTWTVTNKIPSAKLTALREAVFYLLLAPTEFRRILAMKRHTHPERKESLAEYFVRLNAFCLDDVEVVEIDEDGQLRVLAPTNLG